MKNCCLREEFALPHRRIGARERGFFSSSHAPAWERFFELFDIFAPTSVESRERRFLKYLQPDTHGFQTRISADTLFVFVLFYSVFICVAKFKWLQRVLGERTQGNTKPVGKIAPIRNVTTISRTTIIGGVEPRATA